MLLLGIDTATPAVTVALHDGGQPLAQLVTVDAHRHAELLAPAIAKVIADAGASQRDLTGIVVGVGPGPYTGLRVGLVTARVLGAALGIPVHGLCSLDIIAADVDAGGGEFLVATDARRRELYWAHYDGTGRRTVGPEVTKPVEIPAAGLPAAGEGPMLYPEVLPDGLGPAFPAAATLCRIAVAALAAGDPDQLLLPPEPLYLRRPDAREPGAPKRVTSSLPGGRPPVPHRVARPMAKGAIVSAVQPGHLPGGRPPVPPDVRAVAPDRKDRDRIRPDRTDGHS